MLTHRRFYRPLPRGCHDPAVFNLQSSIVRCHSSFLTRNSLFCSVLQTLLELCFLLLGVLAACVQSYRHSSLSAQPKRSHSHLYFIPEQQPLSESQPLSHSPSHPVCLFYCLSYHSYRLCLCPRLVSASASLALVCASSAQASILVLAAGIRSRTGTRAHRHGALAPATAK